jgi:uncharacterized Zn ribbon protein
MVDRRKDKCVCGSKLLYREGDMIVCSVCGRSWEARRSDDKDVGSLADLKIEWAQL